MKLGDFKDIHTHRQDAGPEAIICLPLMAEVPAEGYFSAGVHPWDTATLSPEALEDALQWMERCAAHPRVVAVGEAGIDRLRGGEADLQRRVFERHVAASEAAGKPLIIHAVRSLPELMQMRRQMMPRQTWVIHGYRGNAETARQLLRLGFDISVGERFRPEVLDAVPPERLHRETD